MFICLGGGRGGGVYECEYHDVNFVSFENKVKILGVHHVWHVLHKFVHPATPAHRRGTFFIIEQGRAAFVLDYVGIRVDTDN